MSRIIMPTALAVAVFAVSHTCAADSKPSQPDQTLPVIVLTATKTPEAIDKVPARISVIDEKTIQQSAVTDLPHLLQGEAALNVVQLGGYGQQTSVFTRGTNSNHTLFLKDGARLNPATTSIPNTQFADVSDIERIEVLKGPASVQYGSDAIGGVIQLISATPKKQRLFTTLEAGEQNTYKTVVGADLRQGDLYAQVRGQRLETDGAAILSNVEKKNGYDQKGFSAKAGIDHEDYAASFEAAQNKGTGQYLTYNSSFVHNKPVAQDFLNRLYSAQGRINVLPALSINARVSRAQDELDQRSNTDFAHTEHNEQDLNIKWDVLANQNILLGATRRSTDADYKSSFSKYDETLKTIGYYLQHQYQTDLVTTQAGIRLEDDKRYGSHSVGQFAVRINPTDSTSVFANFGTAFRAPDANQLYGGSSANPKLKPEESRSLELGVDQKLGYGFSTYVSAYRTQVKNLINVICVSTCNGDWVTTFPVYQNVNTDKAKLTGGEAGLKWKQNGWFSNLEYAYVKPKDDTTKLDLLRRPRQTVSLTAGWDNGTYGLNGAIVAKSRAKDFAEGAGLNNTPGYVSGSINAFWQVNPYIRVFTNIENIGDTTYKTAYDGGGVYYIAAPRLASAGVTLSY